VEQLFVATVALEPEAREAFLSTSCGSDLELLHEVQSLISADEQAGVFLSRSQADALTTAFLEAEPTTFSNQTFGQYLILEMLGKGGMGEVYRARDTRLDRDVAIKFVAPEFARDDIRLRRLEREAKMLASLSHPGIATIYGLEYFGESRLLIMELVDGETLDRIIERGPLDFTAAVNVFRQISEALEAAHARGVIHRDLKPSNIKLTPAGKVKLLDFGLAKSFESERNALETRSATSLTGSGVVAGTPAYMSPEQARGEELDQRSDLWSFGAVFYESLTGSRAFGGSSLAETLSNILRQEPDWTRLPFETPSPVVELLKRCLEKDVSQRLSDLSEASRILAEVGVTEPSGTDILGSGGSKQTGSLGDDLRAKADAAYESATTYVNASRLASKYLLPVSVVFLVVVLVALSTRWWTTLRPSAGATNPVPQSIHSLAVLPFENLSGNPDEEYFVAGMQDACINELSQVHALRVISRSSTSKYQSSGKSLPEICRELRTDGVLEGSVSRSGDTIRVHVQLITVKPEERPIWSQSYERGIGNVRGLHGEIARSIAQAVKLNVSPAEMSRLGASRRVDPEAYEAYLRGMYYLYKFTPEGFEKGLSYLHEAVDKDPADPLPYAGLALGYELIGHAAEPQAFRRTKSLALKALEIDNNLGEAHEAIAEIALYWDWDWAAAERSFKQALELNPNLPAAHAHNSWYLLLIGKNEQSIKEMTTASDLDPLNPTYPAWLAWMHWALGDYESGVQAAQQALSIDKNSKWGKQTLVSNLVEQGKYEAAVGITRELLRTEPSMKWAVGYILVRAGKPDEARRIAAELKGSPTSINAWGLAETYSALGELDEAVKWIDLATQQRFSWIPWMGKHRPFVPLRERSDFRDRVSRLNLPKN
jgi:TolB-like protein/Tfp pilus assembly protein PilF/predicted Ser/Thr protein kinase